ncbi:hypothetical protein [Anianabacter salinae]|uniref:hypothetical protein n=1 Tax=Anianabacter salinae TaxID=2851023 RepID=UPI00225DF08A|nr:hypothetical protein [Anianabacter salinae]MBV0913425.1 hypothetical protein [Anianabacter salinae]
MIRQTLAAAALALACTAPVAQAGGSINFSYNAQTSDEARAIRGALAIYGLVQDVQTNGHVTQNGIRNAAALSQTGRGNSGIIHQDGSDHDASLEQSGRRNSHGIFQFGRGASTHVTQSGRGNTGVTFGYGW